MENFSLEWVEEISLEDVTGNAFLTCPDLVKERGEKRDKNSLQQEELLFCAGSICRRQTSSLRPGGGGRPGGWKLQRNRIQ